MTSIRRTLTTRLLFGIAAAVIIGTSVAFLLARDALITQFDEAMLEKARVLALQVDNDEDGISFDLAEGVLPEYERDESPEYYEVHVDGMGRIATSPSLAEGGLDIVADGPRNVVLPDGRPGRAFVCRVTVEYDDEDDLDDDDLAKGGHSTKGAERIVGTTSLRPEADEEVEDEDPPAPAEASITVARSRDRLDATLTRLALGLLLALGLACATVVLLVSSSVRLGLEPVVRMGEEVARIDADTLSRRVAVDGQPAELVPLGATLNRLLERLDLAFDRERRMTASMAHELRTPIAEILSSAEIARKWPDDEQLQVDAVETAQAVAAEMGCVVGALLRLSRRDAGTETVTLEPCDVAAEVARTFAAFAEKAAEKSIGVVAPVSDVVIVEADGDLMHVAVRNLVDNAVSHTPTGGLIESSIEECGDIVTWTIVNSPITITAEDVAHLNEPFWTRDTSRTQREHTGLGITLAESAAAAFGASITFAVRDDAFVASVSMCRNRSVRSRSTVSA